MLADKGFDLRSDAALRARINGVSGARAQPVDRRARPDPFARPKRRAAPRRTAPPRRPAPHRVAQIEKDGFMDEEPEEEEEEEVKATPKKGACKRASKQANKRLVFARARPGARRGAAHPRDP